MSQAHSNLSHIAASILVLTLTSFGAVAKEHGKLFYNDAGFLLAMAIADDALFGYESLDDVRKQRIPVGEDELVLRFKDSALEQPVLRQCTKTGGVTDEPMPRSSFTSILKSTLTNAGYLSGPSIHAIRRQLGKGVDSKFSKTGSARSCWVHKTRLSPTHATTILILAFAWSCC